MWDCLGGKNHASDESRFVVEGFSRSALFVAIVLGSGNSEVVAQAVLDLCGCAGDPTLVDFDAGNPPTYPAGTSGCSSPCSAGTITFTLPPDGVMKFKGFTVNGNFFIRFNGNVNNTPVTVLVAGDVLLRSTVGCCRDLHLGGNNGSSGGNGTAGVGGLGGPGGFRGGDSAALGVNLVTIGGAGQGPGGGVGANQTTTLPGGGTFISVPELVPLIGGSGGGGGAGNSTTVTLHGWRRCGGGGASSTPTPDRMAGCASSRSIRVRKRIFRHFRHR